jgi:N-acetylneuraminic acid mutarotase
MSEHVVSSGRAAALRLITLLLAVGGLLVMGPASAQAYHLLEPCGQIRNAGAPGFWRAENPMPTQYDEPRGVRVGNYVYLAGGIADIDPKTYEATSVDQFLRYDLVSGQYKQMAPMPMRLSHVGITTYNGDIYVVGGLDDDLLTPGATNRAFRYITAEDRWVEIAGLPAARGALGLATVGHYMYAISGVPQGPPGGRQVTDARTAANDAYDFDTGQWSSRAPIPTARDHLGVTAYNGQIYAVGGRTAGNYAHSELERYDPPTDTWAKLAPIPMGSSGVQIVPVNGRLVVASGGDDLVNWVDGRVFSYDPATGFWDSLLPAIPKPVHGYAAADYNGRLNVFGGSECASFAPVTNTESLGVPAPGAAEVPPELEKAAGRPATSSSIKGVGYEPDKALDRLGSTRWSSKFGADGQWWQVDLGASRKVDRVSLDWFTSYATHYTISTSTDGSTWSQAADVTNNAAGTKDTTFAARDARYVRVTGLSRSIAQYGISFAEARVFGPDDGTPAPPVAEVEKAVGHPTSSSSVKGAGYEPPKALDGDANTRWSSTFGSDGQWWQVDLGSSQQLSRVSLNWFTSYATHYKLSTSADGTNWSEAADVTDNAAGTKSTSFPVRTGRYVRVTGLSRSIAQYGISFWEARVYGPSG